MGDEMTPEQIAIELDDLANIGAADRWSSVWNYVDDLRAAAALIRAQDKRARVPLTRDLPENNEDVWAAGMDAIRDMLRDLERDDFKDIGNGYPAAIWGAMYDAAALAGDA